MSLKTNQSLGDLVGIKHKLVIHQILHSFHCKVSHLLISDDRVQKKDSLVGLYILPLFQSSICLCSLEGIRKINSEQVVNQLIALMFIVLLTPSQQLLVLITISAYLKRIASQ